MFTIITRMLLSGSCFTTGFCLVAYLELGGGVHLMFIEQTCTSSNVAIVTLKCYNFFFPETSDMVTRIGGNFKETLRQSGGLDNIFNVMVNCHSELEVRPHFCGTFLFFNRFRQNY